MSELLFAIITASVALIGTMAWLTAVTYFCLKYFEYRMKERSKELGGGGFREMKYQKSRLYKTHEVLSFKTPVKTGKVHDTSTGIILFQDGTLCIPYGYSWDGASGPALDTDNIMAPSLVHDALYELIRDGGLPISWRRTIDEHLYNMCRERGMWWIRAQWIKLALRWFGNRSARKSSKVYEAP